MAAADALPAAIDDEAFDFYGRRIQGKKEQKERYKRVISALSGDMGEALGQRFVEETFPAECEGKALQARWSRRSSPRCATRWRRAPG